VFGGLVEPSLQRRRGDESTPSEHTLSVRSDGATLDAIDELAL